MVRVEGEHGFKGINKNDGDGEHEHAEGVVEWFESETFTDGAIYSRLSLKYLI